ncbi:MAG: ABC transporter substrate binding protein, partial [Burkholderiales bacterium]
AAAMGDPIGSRLVASLARPGGNLTGLSMGWTEGITTKWLELLPRLSTLVVIYNPDNPVSRDQTKELQAIAPTRGLKLRLTEVREPGALDRAFGQEGQKAQGVLVLPDPVIAALRGHSQRWPLNTVSQLSTSCAISSIQAG